ncbi:hypothetical protein ASPZODRAFT_132883 [Penicilliopsis zonata CBS 506.65]|uniref:Enoyl reductase (ER) domain-containing protein n=1 Tax=Penicilliopsis zonata CBS 506.65 TaxID=1073090 RepID=A0A1L9SI89_9EURO|nr:hypothetical protein ASPZODRAFT_132883 [Penicilliopsis zonata CBS 506.65]OJJ46754.1 hypothetical protein ASPZODRAFT_132883 [Penicilliopsis zonata CBS 506.65]
MSTTSTYIQVTELDEEDQPVFHRSFLIKGSSDVIPPSQLVQHVVPEAKQSVLLLNGVREQYTLVDNHNIPSILHDGEILVKVVAIGLNPIDWKAPAFNFGIPALPWINGRDLAGVVVKTSAANGSSRLRVGDIVLVPSTDYRDIRKAAFQEYAIATHFNAARVPSSTCIHASASLGVAFVAAVLALGVSLGLDFTSCASGPNLVDVLGKISPGDIPEDIREECLLSSAQGERLTKGEWIAVWGASTTTGYITLQLAKMAGLKVICVADVARHGAKLLDAGADLLVDRHDTKRAVEIIKGVTGGKLRYAMDIVGKETATLLQETLDVTAHPHLLGLTGLPKERDARIRYHTVPIKLFHTAPTVGESMVLWLEELLQSGTLRLPEIIRAKGGLGGINAALETLRQGTASGKRIVVGLEENSDA